MAFLEVEGLVKTFGRTEVLKNVSFTLGKGEVLAVIGSSGSGKTTLLRCLNFLERPEAGTIRVDGQTLLSAPSAKRDREADIRSKRLHFGLVFQSFNLFPQYTALGNVMLAPSLAAGGKKSLFFRRAPGAENAARALLGQVGLADKADFYPHQLSGGQQQRVAIARALALKPDVLCFDEPTSALDPELTGEVLRVIRSLKPDNTMIVVTHEMEFARSVADKVIFMADGVIEETGTPSEVFGNPAREKTKAFLAKSLENL